MQNNSENNSKSISQKIISKYLKINHYLDILKRKQLIREKREKIVLIVKLNYLK